MEHEIESELTIKDNDNLISVIDRNILLKSLSHIQNVVEKKTILPILTHVMLKAEKGNLMLCGTDMEIMLEETIQANTNGNWQIAVPAHLFHDIIRKFPANAEIKLYKQEKNCQLLVKCASSEFKLSYMECSDFPIMGKLNNNTSIKMHSSDLRYILEQCKFAISSEETRYNLNGIYLTNENEKYIRAVATDMHRLASAAIELEEVTSCSLIIPKKTVNELIKILDDYQGEVIVNFSETKISFLFGQIILISKLIDGTFPNYQQALPSETKYSITINRKLLQEVVDRISAITTEKTRGIKLSFGNNMLTIKSVGEGNSAASEDINIDFSENNIDISFNEKYLLEMLSIIKSDEIVIKLNDSESPAIIEDLTDKYAIYIIMPMWL